MLGSDDCTLSLDDLFFEKPTVPKVDLLHQKARPWLLKEPPSLSQIPATQDLVQEAESLPALYSFSQKPQVFPSPLKGPVVHKVFPSSSFCSFSDNDKENEESWGVSHSTRGYDSPRRDEGFMAFLSGTRQGGTDKEENPQGSSDLSLDCIKIPPLRKSLFKVQVLSCGGDSSNTDDLSSSQAACRPQTFLSHVAMATVPPPPPQPLRATVIQAAPPSPPKAGFSPPPLGSSAARRRPSPQAAHAEMQDKGTKRAFVPPMTPQALHIQGPSGSGVLRPVSEIPSKFRSVFEAFPFFNYIQSKALDDILYTDKNFVACAPTGSGKTVLFELAIIHLLMKTSEPWRDVKAVYLAPIKALCSQCFESWSAKFGPLGLNCKELTGDTEIDDIFEIQDSQIILTTPEKWDSMTRKWRDNCLLQLVRLILIDEVHVVKDVTRGATLEVVVSRMKAVHSYRMAQNTEGGLSMRFVAVSATIPNIFDIADWLSDQDGPATYLDMDESHRPVKLRRVVLGFPCSSNQTEFKFDLTLNYKMANIIQTYSNQKPTLVFCSTRKGVQQAATVLVKDTRFVMSTEHKQRLMKYANSILDSKLRDLMTLGVGYHHAGVDTSDRKLVEKAFTLGDLPVLFTTRTLAMGVNLPAHLVVIKSTVQYVSGACEEYSDSDLLQMIGRAGRPQFDTSATAVIMTKFQTKDKYMRLMNGMEIIESSLHSHLVEHLNAEIVLQTISNVNMALDWIRSTFLYIRALKNPVHYGFSADLDRYGIESKLQELCLKNLNSLSSIDLIDMDEDINIKPTEAGKLMARYCVAFDTMKQFSKVAGMENLSDLIDLVSKAKEFSEIQLRANEKRSLNTMNRDKNRITIRFPMEGKIKTSEMKVNCLIQAHLGSISIQEFGLTQDIAKIFRSGMRIVRCLSEFLSHHSKITFCALLNALILAKCFRAKIWENSPYVSKQLEKIGQMLSTAMVNAGLTTFSKIEQTNPRELELIVNRHPPFGNQIREYVIHLPKYEVTVDQLPRYSCTTAEIVVHVILKNQAQLVSRRTAPAYHYVSLLIGDSDNTVVFLQKILDLVLLRSGIWSKKIGVARASNGDEISVNLISSEYVGLDIQQKRNIYYSGARKVESDKLNKTPYDPTGHKPQQAALKPEPKETPAPQRQNTSSGKDLGNRRPCNHLCKNKEQCGHNCCKVDVTVRERQKRVATQESTVSSHLKDLWNRCDTVAQTPAKRLKMKMSEESGSVNMQEFSYKAPQKLPPISSYRSSHYEASAGPPTVTVDPREDRSQLSNTVCSDSFCSDYDEFVEGMQEMMDYPAQDHTAHGHHQEWMEPGFSASVSQKSELPTNSISTISSAVPKRVSAASNQGSHGNKQLSAQIPLISFDLGNEWDDWSDFDDENLLRASETSSSLFAPAEVLQSVKRTMPGSGITSAPVLLSHSQVNSSASTTRMSLRSVSPTTNPAKQNPGTKTARPLNRLTMDLNKQTPNIFSEAQTVKTPVEPASTQTAPLTQRFDFFSTMNVPANSTMTGNRSTNNSEEEAFLGIFDGIF